MVSTENENEFTDIKERIAHLFFTGDMSDCQFEFCNKKIIEAHKNILGVASPVFKAMLFGELKNKTGPEKIGEIEHEIFAKMLQFIYTDHVELDSVETACSVYAAGEKYILPKLKKHCEDFILLNVNISTVFYLLDFLEVYENKVIKNECLNFIRSETKSVFNCEHFLRLDVRFLNIIAEQPALNIDSEVELFKAVERWAKNKAEETEVSVSEIIPSISSVIKKIRFLSMECEEFAKGPALSELLSLDEQLAVLLNILYPGVCSVPKHLCSFRKQRPPRIKHEYKFTGVSGKMDSSGLGSPEFFVKKTKWKLQLAGKPNESNKYNHVVLLIWFKGHTQNSDPCTANVELKLLSHKSDSQHLKICFKQKFERGDSSWSNPLAVEWSKMFGENSEFLKENSVTVEATIEPEPELEES